MQSISLIVLMSSPGAAAKLDILSCRRVLQEQAGEAPVEIILAGAVDDRDPPLTGVDPTIVPAQGEGPVGRFARGSRPHRANSWWCSIPGGPILPQAVAQVIDRLRTSEADLAIAVPKRQRGRPWWQALGRRCLGLASEASLGTSDVFSGLMAVRRWRLSEVPTVHQPRGSRLVLDLLAWPCGVHLDVPVDTLPDDRLLVGRPGLDDVRQLKRVLDQRFGTFSRLVQFCMVGASGMVVDLTCYALFQVLFARFWPAPATQAANQFSWHLAAARALAILVALVWNFTLNRRLTFNDARSGSIARQFLTYTLGNALGIAVSMTLSLWLPMRLAFFAQHKLAAAVVGIIVATGISFSMSRWVVFIRRPAGLPDDEAHPPRRSRTRSTSQPSCRRRALSEARPSAVRRASDPHSAASAVFASAGRPGGDHARGCDQGNGRDDRAPASGDRSSTGCARGSGPEWQAGRRSGATATSRAGGDRVPGRSRVERSRSPWPSERSANRRPWPGPHSRTVSGDRGRPGGTSSAGRIASRTTVLSRNRSAWGSDIPAVARLTESHQSHWSLPVQTRPGEPPRDVAIVGLVVAQGQGVTAMSGRPDRLSEHQGVAHRPGRQDGGHGNGQRQAAEESLVDDRPDPRPASPGRSAQRRPEGWGGKDRRGPGSRLRRWPRATAVAPARQAPGP